MELHQVDLAIIVCYLALVIGVGWMLSKRAGKDLDSYFLGGKSIPWYILGVSHGAAGFDIGGTMWFVLMLYVYGVKGVWILWMWPMFAMIFRMMYLGVWIRRSNVLTGAEWIRTRFGDGPSGTLAHLSVVAYALVSVIGFLSMAFLGVGKFAQPFLPWDVPPETYGLVIMCVTAAYLIVGGMYSVVVTDLMQFALLLVSAICISWIAIQHTTPEQIGAAVPAGWNQFFFGAQLDIDWSQLMPKLQDQIEADHSSVFSIFVSMMLFKGILVSMAGPAPGYGIQNVLATRSPKEAALESWWINVIAFFPRFLLIAAIVVLALGPLNTEIKAMEGEVDFEQLLPTVIGQYVPIGLTGLVVAGLLAAFMSTFDSTVNSASAYVTNDIYKRYINPNARPKTYVYMGYACSLLVIVTGIGFGYLTESIHTVTQFIVSGLFGAYTAPNVLKWYWWRFNGYGFCAGMASGMIAALAFAGIDKWAEQADSAAIETLPWLLQYPVDTIHSLTPLETFPFLCAISAVVSVVVCLLTPPERDEILDAFYTQVRPWGFWGPVYRRIAQRNPEFRKNTDFPIDAFNCVVGIAWQTTLVTTPIYLVLRDVRALSISTIALIATSVLLKFTWYDRLGPGDMVLSDDA